VQCAALLLTSYASNQGKTTVTAALAHLFKQQGKQVRVFKIGPDYLDPKLLQIASGHPVYQLDLWMVGEQECRRLLFEAAAKADIILVEGVMGLFDGVPSSADLAKLIGLPIAGIINASSMAQSLHAVAFGLANFDPALNYVGTLANCVASEKHASMIAEQATLLSSDSLDYLEHSRLLPYFPAYLGALMRSPSIAIPSRHLGLQDAAELSDIQSLLKAGAEQISGTSLPHAPLAVAFSAPTQATDDCGAELSPKLLQGIKVAIARDLAFSFIYQANIDCLEQMGAELFYFSPLANQELPDVDALYLPGGYPELYLEQLEQNHNVMASIERHAKAGKAIYAECGGMLYLLEELTDASGKSAKMIGLLKGRAHLQKRLAKLGYQQFDLAGGIIRGHTFHYSTATVEAEVIAQASHPQNNSQGEEMFRTGSITASYAHLYFSSNKKATANFFRLNSHYE
jgi:cobyrinic acid a,c-diamide synthase